MNYNICSMQTENSFIEIKGLCKGKVFLKIEGLNPAGSIKFKPALAMVGALEDSKTLNSKTRLIESSSGNLGVALSIICAQKGIPFTCVIDPNTSAQNRKVMETLGAEVVLIDKLDENGGFLGSRINYIKERTSKESDTIWLNQYSNPENAGSHERSTAREMSEYFSRIDYLFIGAGTTGTLMGCKNYFSSHRPDTKVVGVDSEGSVTFGNPASKRYIPGLGTSRKPEIFNPSGLYKQVMVPEAKAVIVCRWLAKTHGFLAGGSTGTVLGGIYKEKDEIGTEDIVLTISPDLGMNYLDTIYNDEWVVKRFGEECLNSELSYLD